LNCIEEVAARTPEKIFTETIDPLVGLTPFQCRKIATAIGASKYVSRRMLAAAAKTQGRTVVDEPEPDKGYYYRSDQLNFARAGVPALYFKSGQTYVGRPAGWGKAREEEYRKLHYHQPSDEVTPAWDLTGMVEDDLLAYRVGLDVAGGANLPAWYPGDEFEAARKKALQAPGR
jgi:Zn-dependent M28 family amino/carboxypeptidase